MSDISERKENRQFADQLHGYRRDLFRFVLRRVGGDVSIADDLTQDCLVRVWETRRAHPPAELALRVYLLATARNLLRDRFRRSRTRSGSDLPEPRIVESPESDFLVREMIERLFAEILRMPALLRETLLLRVKENLDYGEIARRVGCPVGTVKSRLNAARSHLRKILEDGNDPGQSNATVRSEITSEWRTGSEYLVETDTSERKAMTTKPTLAGLQEELHAVQQRLAALEGTSEQPTLKDIYVKYREKLAADLKSGRENRGTVFALGINHIFAQSPKSGACLTASRSQNFTSVFDLPTDEQITTRFEKMRLIVSNPVYPKLFKHFFVLRFAGREMSASAAELGETVGMTVESTESALEPLVAAGILRVVRMATGDEYEWGGNDPIITTMLFVPG